MTCLSVKLFTDLINQDYMNDTVSVSVTDSSRTKNGVHIIIVGKCDFCNLRSARQEYILICRLASLDSKNQSCLLRFQPGSDKLNAGISMHLI